MQKIGSEKSVRYCGSSCESITQKLVKFLSNVGKASAIAKALGSNKFKASSGWLDTFKTRYNTVWNKVCGELQVTEKV